MANSYPLDLVLTPQVVPLAGSPGPFHNIILAFDAAPTAGTALIEYRNLADPTWKPLSHANGITVAGNFFQARLDGSVAALRITFTGLVGGAGARIWDDISAQPSGLYAGLSAITTQPYTEANVKNGLQYNIRSAWPLTDPIATGTSRKIWFKTTTKPVIIKLRELQYLAEELKIELFRAPTGVSGGTDLTVHNYNAVSAVPTTVQAKKNVTITGNGTPFDAGDPEYFFGGANDPQRQIATILQGRERILPANTEFAVVITNTGGGSARVQYFLDFYEGGTDLPL